MNKNLSYAERLNHALRVEHEKVYDSVQKKLKEDVSERVESCPICSSKKQKIYCVKDHFIHVRCKNCSFVYLNLRLNNEATFSFYNSDVNEIYNEEKFHSTGVELCPDDILNINNYNLLKKHIPDIQGKKILEIGPGRGAFLKEAYKDGLDVNAIELNKLLIKQLEEFCNYVYTQDLLELNLEAETYDIVYFRDVIEHIPDPMPFLDEVFRILKPGGYVFIDTHNIDSLVNKATGKYHTVVFAFEHPVHWSPKTLKLACEKSGFDFVKSYNNIELNFSLNIILDYYRHPSFTYIFSPKIGRLKNFTFRILKRILSIGIIEKLDRTISESLVKMTDKGSKMQAIFRKP